MADIVVVVLIFVDVYIGVSYIMVNKAYLELLGATVAVVVDIVVVVNVVVVALLVVTGHIISSCAL